MAKKAAAMGVPNRAEKAAAIPLGSNGAMMQGMALVIIGGLVASTLLTLLLMPTIYLLIHKKKRRKLHVDEE